MKITNQRLKQIVKEAIKEAYYGSIPGEPETPAGYGGAVDRAKVQQHLSDEIDDLVRLGKLDINDLSIETVRANQEIPWDKFQAIDDEVLGDIIRDYQRRKKFYREGVQVNEMKKKITKGQLIKIIKEEVASVQELQADPAYDSPAAPESRGTMSQENTNAAKGAAMALLGAAKAMEQAPSHEPASLYAGEVAKQANLIMDMLVSMGT